MVGQLIQSLLYGDPSQQMGQALNPNPANPTPNPAPGAPGGAAGGQQGSTPPAQPLPPANATQSPPDLAALYMQLHQQDRSANQIDRGAALMASAFGTAQQQHDMMQYAGSLQPDDRASGIGQMLKNQAVQTELRDNEKFKAGAAGMGQLLGVSGDQASWLALHPEILKDMVHVHAQNMAEPDQLKLVDAATSSWASAHPGISQEEIDSHRAGLLEGIASGGDTTTKEMMTAGRDWTARHPGQPLPERFTSPAAWKGFSKQIELGQTAVAKNTIDYDKNISSIKPVEENLDWLTKPEHFDNVVHALHFPNFTEGYTGQALGTIGAVGKDTLDARNKLNYLMEQLYSTNFIGESVNSGRLSQQEAERLQASLTNLKKANTMSPEEIKGELTRLSEMIKTAHGNVMASAGKEVPDKYRNYVNPAYFDPDSPIHSGATFSGGGGPSSSSGGGGGKTYTYNRETGQLE